MSYPPFTLEGYRSTIGGILARGYSLADFHSVKAASPHLVLRHDIDQSIARARALADIEAAERWRSTYFVLVRTDMYNLRSRENTGHLRAMIDMGHEVGLHLDATQYGSERELEAGAAAECRCVEDAVGQPVRMVSFHRPAPERMGGETPIAGRPHTYMDRFTKSMGYSSDSRGEWRHGHPWDHASLPAKQALQLLTHAVWWTGPVGQNPRQRLADVVTESASRLNAELAANNQVWAEMKSEPLSSAARRDGLLIEPLTRTNFEAEPDAFVAIGQDVPGEYWTAAHFRKDLPMKWQLSVAAWQGQTLIGYAIVSSKERSRAHLHHLMLGTNWRNNGIGRFLLEDAFIRAREAGHLTMTLKVAKANPARRFYVKMGFRENGEENGYLVYKRAL